MSAPTAHVKPVAALLRDAAEQVEALDTILALALAVEAVERLHFATTGERKYVNLSVRP